ncbi:hypothetical protein ACP26L_36015 (plasmid) [Paenibacillus sp. S-38]|uniref:hypothetical protein n=1 Tax=Paenibacillus sp. S-38 TaxID=3416710 RepID=UPI003CF28199
MIEKDSLFGYDFTVPKDTPEREYSQLELQLLASQTSLHDVFDVQASVDDSLIQEYHERSKRKTEDDKWLKSNKPAILAAMTEIGRDKKDFGSYRVSVVTPDESRFDMAKVLEYLEQEHIDPEVYIACTQIVVNEAALAECIENGRIDLDDLKEAAWIEKSGTARLTVKSV